MIKNKVKNSKTPSWEEVGKVMGKKFGEEFKNKKFNKNNWKTKFYCCHSDSGFVGRVLFIIGVLIALNMAGIMVSTPTWVQILIGVGFALMKF